VQFIDVFDTIYLLMYNRGTGPARSSNHSRSLVIHNYRQIYTHHNNTHATHHVAGQKTKKNNDEEKTIQCMTCLIYSARLLFVRPLTSGIFLPNQNFIQESTRDGHGQRKHSLFVVRPCRMRKDPPRHAALPSKKMQSKPRNAKQVRSRYETRVTTSDEMMM
jgi:hypothetical protein